MSDVKKLEVIPTIKDGIGIGAKNIGPILVNCLLYILTCWIPYLNIGTTIGLLVGVIAKASKGQAIEITEIFNPEYRKYMGEFFLTSGLMSMGIIAALCFFIVPGLVLSIAWSLSLLLAVDKQKNPSEAISLSNKLTYGYKAKMFGINLLTGLALTIIIAIFAGIGAAAGGAIAVILGLIIFAAIVFYFFVLIGIQASIYKQLSEGV